nr:hypothetical protein [Schwartzia sp. (in: firmicutes)]
NSRSICLVKFGESDADIRTWFIIPVDRRNEDGNPIGCLQIFYFLRPGHHEPEQIERQITHECAFRHLATLVRSIEAGMSERDTLREHVLAVAQSSLDDLANDFPIAKDIGILRAYLAGMIHSTRERIDLYMRLNQSWYGRALLRLTGRKKKETLADLQEDVRALGQFTMRCHLTWHSLVDDIISPFRFALRTTVSDILFVEKSS